MASAASAGVTFPTQEGGERIVPRDKASAILTVFNCFQGGGGLGQGSFFADHGKVTFREGKMSVCSQSNYPVGFAYYTPNRVMSATIRFRSTGAPIPFGS